MEFASNQTLNQSVKTRGNVGSGHVVPSKTIKREKIEVSKILMVSERFNHFALHRMKTFYLPKAG